MPLLDDLIRSVGESKAPVKDVRVGIAWTGVWSKYLGLARTYATQSSIHYRVKDWGMLAGKSATDLAEYARSWHLVEAGVGVAAINSMIEPKGRRGINALDLLLEEGKGKRITVVGAFPKLSELRSVSKDLWVLELNPYLVDPDAGILPATAAEHKIPKSDLVAITSSAITNRSMEHLLELSSDAYTIVLGPGTPMSEILFDYGADLLAGARVTEPEAILKKLSQGGGMMSPRSCVGEIEYLAMEK